MNFLPIILLAICFLLGVPIAFSLIIACIPYFLMDGFISVQVIVQRMVSNTESVSLMAIPFFVLAGSIMNYSGITKRLMNLCDTLVGHKIGGLGHGNVLLSTLMGGISGSGAADAAMECKLLVPEMIKRGYDKDFSAAVTAASATITPIIPPGVCLIVYAFICEISVGKVLCSGYIPGLMMCLGMMLMVGYISRKKGYKPSRETRASGKEIWKATKDAMWALFLPFGLVLGLRIGIFTATEGGALMAVYSLLVGKFIYKELKFRDLPKILLDALLSMASVMMILCAANVFSYYMSWERIPQELSTLLIGMSSNKYVFLILVNVLFLFLGMFLDGMASLIILAPLFAPVAQALGIDLVHFGLVICLNVGIGAITPPFGQYIYLVSSTVHIRAERLIKALLPFVGVCLIILILVTYIPWLSTFIPNLVY